MDAEPGATHAVLAGVRVPRLIYGTAWKEDRTAGLVGDALAAGFRGLDTANQRKHYHEAGVGEGLRASTVPRDRLFLQTKFTFRTGQDHRLPYDPLAPIAQQVQQSLASSLDHLGTDRLDAYLLHGPSQPIGLGEADWEAWRAMEAAHNAGKASLLGVSNVNADQLDELLASATVRPRVVQNRSYTRPHADAAVRQLCAEHGLGYEGFSLLTGHPLVRHPHVAQAAARLGATAPQVVLRHALDRGILALTGTTSREHMAQDLAVRGLRLGSVDAAAMDRLLGWAP